jgi:hypothetical protein
MLRDKTWRWEFLAFKSNAEGCPVQRWFDSLPDEDKYEITDLLDTLQKTNDRLWPEAAFDGLKGAGGISEIKFPNIRCFRDGKVKSITYRIYGFFGPTGLGHCYTFLHGTEKEVKNDIHGKQIAKGRLDELGRGGYTASVVKFDFEKDSSKEVKEEPRSPN